MSAEPQLHNPAIFNHPVASSSSSSSVGSVLHPSKLYPLHADLALEYLNIVSSLKTTTTPSAVKAHVFKLMAPALPRETDLRERLGRASTRNGVVEYVDICKEMQLRMKV